MENKKVRCKFRCNEITDHGDNKYTAKMSAVYSDKENSENKKYWDASPGGNFEMNYTTGKHFDAGKEYYIDIIEA